MIERQGYNLNKFLDAQNNGFKRHSNFSTALSEIKEGEKKSDWIWYIFPQLSGFGYSYESSYFALRNLEEAEAYLKDSKLRDNYLTITEALLAQINNGKTLESILIQDGDDVDVTKVISSLTLMRVAAENIKGKTFNPDLKGKLDQIVVNANNILNNAILHGREPCQDTLDQIEAEQNVQEKFTSLKTRGGGARAAGASPAAAATRGWDASPAAPAAARGRGAAGAPATGAAARGWGEAPAGGAAGGRGAAPAPATGAGAGMRDAAPGGQPASLVNIRKAATPPSARAATGAGAGMRDAAPAAAAARGRTESPTQVTKGFVAKEVERIKKEEDAFVPTPVKPVKIEKEGDGANARQTAKDPDRRGQRSLFTPSAGVRATVATVGPDLWRSPSPNSPHRRSPDQLNPAQSYATRAAGAASPAGYESDPSRHPTPQAHNNRVSITTEADASEERAAGAAGGEPTHTPGTTPPVSSQRSATLPNTTGTGEWSETDSDAETTSRTPRRPFTDRVRRVRVARAALARTSGDRPTQEKRGEEEAIILNLQETIQDLQKSIDELKRDKDRSLEAGMIEALKGEIEEEKKNFSDELNSREEQLNSRISALQEYIKAVLETMPEDRREEIKKIEALQEEIAELNRKVAKQDNADPSDSPPPPSNESDVDKKISEIAAAIGGIRYDNEYKRFVRDSKVMRTKNLADITEYEDAISIIEDQYNSSRYKDLSERLIQYADIIFVREAGTQDTKELEFFSKLLKPKRITRNNNEVVISFQNNFQNNENTQSLALVLATWNREAFNEYITKYSNQPAYRKWKDNKGELEDFMQENSDLKAKQANNNDKREELGAGKAKNNIGMSFSSFIGLASLITGIALAVIFQNPYLLFITSGTIISTIGYFACSSNYDKYQKEDKKLNQKNREITDKITKNSEEIKLLNDQLNGKETRGTTKNTRVKGIEMG